MRIDKGVEMFATEKTEVNDDVQQATTSSV